MIFKIIALIAVAIPIFLFARSVFFQRTTRMNEGLREFKKQANLAVSIFLFLIVCLLCSPQASWLGRGGRHSERERRLSRTGWFKGPN
jgi:hypothetical protein